MGSDFTNFQAGCHGPVPRRRLFRGRTSRKRSRTIDQSQGTREHRIFRLFHREGKPIKSFRRAWLAACKRAGIARLVTRGQQKIGYPLRILHDFRRTAVRNLERAEVPRSTAMAMVGMRTESIYRRWR